MTISQPSEHLREELQGQRNRPPIKKDNGIGNLLYPPINTPNIWFSGLLIGTIASQRIWTKNDNLQTRILSINHFRFVSVTSHLVGFSKFTDPVTQHKMISTWLGSCSYENSLGILTDHKLELALCCSYLEKSVCR